MSAKTDWPLEGEVIALLARLHEVVDKMDPPTEDSTALSDFMAEHLAVYNAPQAFAILKAAVIVQALAIKKLNKTLEAMA